MVETSSYFYLQIITASLLAVIAVNDVVKREVPNVLLLVFMVVLSVNTPFSVSSLLICFSILAFGIFAFHRGWLGAGDSKLLAICAYASLEQWYWLLMTTALLGGALSVIYLVFNRMVRHGVIIGTPSQTVPYAVSICGAAMTTIHYM